MLVYNYSNEFISTDKMADNNYIISTINALSLN